jgi:glycosyltransferase involved in cell wall biosynthesis
VLFRHAVKKAPLISIIIPVLNRRHQIESTLVSIVRQKFKSIEVILSDGGSGDHTVDFVLAELGKAGIDVSVIISPGSSVYGAINLGLQLARGDWLYILGSDDQLYDENSLQTMASHLLKTSADAVYGDAWFERSAGFLYGGAFWPNRFNVSNICHQSIFYRASALKKLGVTYNEQYRILADWDYNIKLFSRLPFEHVSLPIAKYACYGLSDSQVDELFLADLHANMIDYFGLRAYWLLTPDWLSLGVARRPTLMKKVLLALNRLVYALGRRVVGKTFGRRPVSVKELYVSPPKQGR